MSPRRQSRPRPPWHAAPARSVPGTLPARAASREPCTPCSRPLSQSPLGIEHDRTAAVISVRYRAQASRIFRLGAAVGRMDESRDSEEPVAPRCRTCSPSRSAPRAELIPVLPISPLLRPPSSASVRDHSSLARSAALARAAPGRRIACRVSCRGIPRCERCRGPKQCSGKAGWKRNGSLHSRSGSFTRCR